MLDEGVRAGRDEKTAAVRNPGRDGNHLPEDQKRKQSGQDLCRSDRF